MELKNKTFLVYGMGVSGISAYNFLNNKNAKVYLYSDKITEDTTGFNIIKKSELLKIKFDYVVLSPGVQIIGNNNIKKLKEMGALIISELELGYLFCRGKFVAVTGTNGKTTCVNLLNFILSKHYKTFLCGNVGTPITSICDDTTSDSIIICEVSSFMLELTSKNFAPDIAVITNITPDHISRHKTFEGYYNAKLKITENQTKDQFLILDKDLQDIKTDASKIILGKKKYFKSKLLGDFNQTNILQCFYVCELLGVSEKTFRKELKDFYPVKFRLECLGKKKGITYINDSKSTNPDSTIKALEAMKKKVIVLLGGSDKGNDFNDIFKCKNIKIALIYGQTANKLEQDALVSGFYKTSKFDNLNDTLYYLNQFTKRGDVVLFSPACASYDEFKNYIERGEFFNKFYEEL